MSPVPVLTREEAQVYSGKLTDFISRYASSEAYSDWTYYKTYLLLTWVHELAGHPVILERVEALIGSDVLLWNAFLLPNRHSPKSISGGTKMRPTGPSNLWRQVVSVWLALSPVGPANGGMRMIPGSHLWGQLPHEKTYDSSSMLRRGQRVTGAVDETNAVDIVLAIGEASFHHTGTLHGSGANRTDAWRLGVGLNYVGGDVGPVVGHSDSALLLRGSAEHSGFMLKIPPRVDLDAQALEHYDEIVHRSRSRYRDVRNEERGRE